MAGRAPDGTASNIGYIRWNAEIKLAVEDWEKLRDRNWTVRNVQQALMIAHQRGFSIKIGSVHYKCATGYEVLARLHKKEKNAYQTRVFMKTCAWIRKYANTNRDGTTVPLHPGVWNRLRDAAGDAPDKDDTGV